MAYRVHRFDIDMEDGRQPLEDFLNSLQGEVIAVIPNIRKTSLAQIYGATRKIDFLFVIERV